MPKGRRSARRKTRKKRPTIEGTLYVSRPGHAQVRTAEGTFDVARRGLREGMNGDEVLVSLVPMRGHRGAPVAYVQSVVQRACASFVGTYEQIDPLGVVSPLDARLSHDFFVLPEDTSVVRHGIESGDVVRVRIVEYPTRASSGVVTIEQKLGSSEGLDMGVEAIIASYGLATQFSEAALEEAKRTTAQVDEALRGDGRRRDLRKVPCVTIDPFDARDYDDAVGAREVEGGYELDVHIADVTHYVSPACSMDLEARRRTCSVYLVDRVLPMLPERLCNDVCSLRPHEDRLAVTVRMRLDARGHVVEVDAFPSAICSDARLTYDQVDALLTGGVDLADHLPPTELHDMLRLLDRIARLRLRVREERGAIDFVSIESKVRLDDNGRPLGITLRKRTRATSLVEEAMLLANESIAKMLADRDVATAYRVHERPSPEDLKACVPELQELDLLRGVGEERLVAAEPAALQAVLAAAQSTGGEVLANSLLLRAQKRAIYAPHNEGHYALGAKAYCHFTSPIRRYPDVLVHRALKYVLAAEEQPDSLTKALPQLCRACSEQERTADNAARVSQDLKMAEYYAERIGERYSGVVVSCERFGAFVRLDDTGAEGLLPARHMTPDRSWYLGKHVAVQVEEVDLTRGRIDFVLV